MDANRCFLRQTMRKLISHFICNGMHNRNQLVLVSIRLLTVREWYECVSKTRRLYL